MARHLSAREAVDDRDGPTGRLRQPRAVPPYTTLFGPEPFTAWEISDVRLARDQLRLLVAQGRVRRVVQGVYVDALVPDSLELRAKAVARVVPTGRVLCGRTAAWLWGVDALAMGAHLVLPDIDVMGGPGTAALRRSGALGCTGPLPDTDLDNLAGVALTSPARTAADLSRLLRRPDALAALDALLRLPGLEPEQIRAVLDRFVGYRGVVQGRELVAIADGRSESPQESRTRLRCVDAGFPAPEPQVKVFDLAGTFVARLDMGWRAWLKAVEFDGDADHSSSRQQRRDGARRRRVESCGWGLAVVTTEQVMGHGLAFEHGIAELLGVAFKLTRNHPRYGGWQARTRWAA